MCSGSEAGSYLRLIDFVYHSTLGSRVIKKKRREDTSLANSSLARFMWWSFSPASRGSRAMAQLLHRNVQRFRGGLVFKAHRLVYHSTLGLREIAKKRRWACLDATRRDTCDIQPTCNKQWIVFDQRYNTLATSSALLRYNLLATNSVLFSTRDTTYLQQAVHC